ncbi:MAG: hypothetical protein ACKO8S_01415 [Actinomycetota bacterium]
MKPIGVNAEREYQVLFTESWSEQIRSLIGARRFIILTQASLRDRVVDVFPEDSIIVTADGEEQKSLTTFTTLLEDLGNRGLDRNSLII